MEKQKLLKNLRHRLSLLLCLMAFLAVGQGAWGVTYYVYGGENQSPMSNSYLGSTETTSYTWSRTFYTGKNYYLIFTTTQSNSETNLKNNAIFCGSTVSKTSEFSAGESNEYSNIKSLRFAMSSQQTSITISISDISGKGTGSSAKYSLSAGGSPTPPTCTYWMKHPWNGKSWSYKELTSDGKGGYTITNLYGSGGCNINNDNSGTGEVWFELSKITVVGDPSSGDECIFRYVPGTSDCSVKDYGNGGRVTITKVTSATAPTVRLGEKPEETGSYDVNVSAYVAATGCADITKFTVYYSKSSISSTSGSGVYKKEFPQSPAPALGSTTTLTLPSADLATNGWSTGGDLYIRITGTNSAGESELSDEIKLSYTVCAGIITSLVINPSSTQLTVNTPQTFTYTANDGATVNSVQWYKNDLPVATTTDYTFTPTTGDSFTIGLKAYNKSCNPTGFDAEPQTYTVCVPTTAVQITNCPVNPERGTPITFTATGIGGTPAEWVWTVNGEVQQEITVEGNTSSITYTPQTATTYTVVATASSCDGTEPSAQCVFVVLKSFTATNLEKTFSACAGGHQFAWSEMFTPTPDSWSAVETTGGTDATALFTLNNGVMIWNNDGKTDGTYTYTFTAVKEGYKNATANITITYTAATTPSGTIGDITITSGDNPTYPWTKVELSCPINVTGSDIDHVVWSCSNSGLVVSTGVAEGTATAYFKGKNVRKDTDYTITAVGQNESCGSTDPQTTVITVQPEEEEVCY